MSFIDKNLSQKNGSVERPESKNINVNVVGSSNKSRRPIKLKISLRGFKKFVIKKWRLLLSLLVVIVITVLAYGYINTKHDLENLSGNKAASQDAKNELVKKVGKLVELPTNEVPSTATVSDSSKLQNQEFFANSKNGDKVLVFAKSGRAVLYRPSTNKVIEFSKVNLNTNQ
jgi:hypothetical protein